VRALLAKECRKCIRDRMKIMFSCFSEMNHRDEVFPNGCLLFRHVVVPNFTTYIIFYIKDNDDWFNVQLIWTEHPALPAVVSTPGLTSPPTNRSHALTLAYVVDERQGGLLVWHLATTPFLCDPPFFLDEIDEKLLLPRVNDAVADCMALIKSHGIDYLRRATADHGLDPAWLDAC